MALLGNRISIRSNRTLGVMPALLAGIHDLLATALHGFWMAGTSQGQPGHDSLVFRRDRNQV
jgi:hypothetical protein